MCGIVGILGNKSVRNRLVSALKKLEYRGYDSSGISILNQDNLAIQLVKSKGKIANLEEALLKNPIDGIIGITHTRWATHGKPNEINAHPHATGKVSVVHNGIIENYQIIKDDLIAKNYNFISDTDTEVIAQLITYYLDSGLKPLEATQKTISQLEGSFAIAVIFTGQKMMIGARKGAPLVVGYGEGESYIGSDIIAIADLTNKVCYLEEGDIAHLTYDNVTIYDQNHHIVERRIQVIDLDQNIIDKSGYDHYMLKEIFQQPQTIANCLNQYIDFENHSLKLPALSFNWKNIKRINIVACGSSYYAASCAKYQFESIAKIPVEVEIASEFRYRDLCLEENGLSIFISQSGETADTLAALRYAKSLNQHILCLVNVPTSSMAREADTFIEIHAGVEIGVAATKSFTAQLTTLICLILDCAENRKFISSEQIKQYIEELSILPGKISTCLTVNDQIQIIAKEISKSKNVLFIGRGTSFAVAQEGALKLKELSYIHAEALAAGELKHGTIALIDEEMPVIVIAPEDKLFSKTASNTNEIAARGGKIITFSSISGNEELKSISDYQINIIKSSDFLAPIFYAIALQILAYHTSCYLNNDIDQPRNLAKSVTVE